MKMAAQSLQFAQILRRFAKLLERMELDEIERVLQALEAGAPFEKSRDAQPSRGIRGQKPKLHLGKDEIMDRLQQAPDREAGASLLRELSLSKRDLLDLARNRSVHIMKEDSLRRIEEKLVEAIIGSKLNSQAIRGTPEEDKSPPFTPELPAKGN
jgi:hypothetical protein